MAQELSEEELLRVEVERLKKEVKNPRAPVSLLLPSLLPLLHPSLVLTELEPEGGSDGQWGGGTSPGQGKEQEVPLGWGKEAGV